MDVRYTYWKMLLTNSTLNCPTSMSKIVVVSDRVNSITKCHSKEGKGEDMNFMFEWQEQEGHKTIANAKHVIFLLLCGLYLLQLAPTSAQ